MVSQYKFYYFPIRGRGESIRLLLADNNIEYEEISVGNDRDTWVNDWKWKMPFGQAPLLEDGDVELAQSMTILRYLGRKHGRSGTSLEDRGKLDMVNDYVEDIRTAYIKLIYGNYEEDKEDYNEELEKKLQPLEHLLMKWGDDYITKSIAFADYNLLSLLDIHLILAPECLYEFPYLRAYYQRLLNRPHIKEYMESDGFKARRVNFNGKQ